MAYIEKQKNGNKTHFYLTQTLRCGSSFKKVRVLLSKEDVGEEQLRLLVKSKEKELLKKVEDTKKSFLLFDASVDLSRVKQRHLIWERPSTVYLVLIPAESCWTQMEYYGYNWGVSHCFFRDGMVKMVWDKRTVIKNGISIINNVLKEEYFDQMDSDWKKRTDLLVSMIENINTTNLELLDDDEFLKFHDKYWECLHHWWKMAQVAEPVGHAGEYLLLEKMSEKDIPVVTVPSKKSYTTIEEEELMRISLEISQNKKLKGLWKHDGKTIFEKLPTYIKEKITEHTKEYFWMLNNYSTTCVLDELFFITQLKEFVTGDVDVKKILCENDNRLREGKRAKKDLIKKLGFSELYKKLVEIVDYFCIFQDDRKEISLRHNHSSNRLLAEVSRRTGIDKKLLDFCTPYEVNDILNGSFDINELARRKKYCLYVIDGDEMRYYACDEAKKKERQLIGVDDFSKINEFEGMRAGIGKAVGCVRKVLDPRDAGDFEEGDILVTTMTSPDFVPLIKKAAAIVTDEGGVTSHAAVVAREFGVPCVIGTKIATDVLCDGDKVEVNGNHGFVKILDRA